MSTSTAGRDAWEYTPPREDSYAVVSPAENTAPWWTAIIITDDETSAQVGRMMVAAPALAAEVAQAAVELDEAANLLARTYPRTADVLRKAAEKKRAALALAEGR